MLLAALPGCKRQGATIARPKDVSRFDAASVAKPGFAPSGYRLKFLVKMPD